MVAIAFCLLLQIRSCNKEEKKVKLIKAVIEEVVTTASGLFTARTKELCGHQKVVLADYTSPQKTPKIVGSLECDDTAIAIYLAETDVKLEFDIKHANLQTRIEIGKNIPADIDDYTRNYIQKCVWRFMKRLENIALNTNEIKKDLEQMKKLRATDKVSPDIGIPEILQNLTEKDDRVKRIYESLVARLCTIVDQS